MIMMTIQVVMRVVNMKWYDIDINEIHFVFVSFSHFKEKILAKRKRRRGGGFEYYIKWVGYDDSANEWIPEVSLSCPERVAEFEREEAKKRQEVKKERYQPSKRRSSFNNHQKSRKKRRRTKILDNDDEDGDDGDNNNYPHQDEQKAPSSPSEQPVKSVESTNSSSTQSDKDSNANLSMTYGVEKGYKVQAILGINRSQGDQLHYLVHYKAPTMFEDNMELIPSTIAKKYCEDEIIQFFETRIAWNERINT